ncbi:MAG TPA: inositol monophosphatase [Acetobacteraceae bacterium]|nr:inositol monophosphatase [Acetobacteraceae bacterium]
MRALQGRFETAVALATEAGALAMRMRAATTATLKGPQDWVTEADGAIERFLSERLAAAFPADGFQGEEGGVVRGGSLRWVADPIDGTANYMRDWRRFCISLACLEDRTPLIGVIVAPALGETYVARQGGGAMLNGTPIRAAETAALDRAVIEVGWSRRRPDRDFLALCEKLLAQGASLRLGGSGTLGLAEVAAGRTDAYVELHINLWDVAAALVLLAEAGATVSRFLDGDGPTGGNPILACAPGVAEALSTLTGYAAR